jgi:hypothetical protein
MRNIGELELLAVAPHHPLQDFYLTPRFLQFGTFSGHSPLLLSVGGPGGIERLLPGLVLARFVVTVVRVFLVPDVVTHRAVAETPVVAHP